MRVLGIDTHGPFGGAALLDGDELVAEVFLSVKATHSEQLLPNIESLLAAAPASPVAKPVDAIAVAVGPGSFTGLRIGVVTAKSLAYAWNVPVVGVSTLEALAFQTRPVAQVQVGMVSSRRERLFAGAFRYSLDAPSESYAPPTAVVEPGHYVIDEFLRAVAEVGEPVVCAGDAVRGFAAKIESYLGERWIRLPVTWERLHSVTIAEVGRRRIEAGEHTDPFALAPEYLRKSEAEIRWQSKFKS